MKIVLIRHFRVGFTWKRFSNAVEYADDCEGYNAAAVIKTPLDISAENYRLIASTMPRALETSRIIFGRDPDAESDALCEVPIRPFIHTRLKLPKRLWDVVGRIQWYLNMPGQPESFRESTSRVARFVDDLVSAREDAIVICHGWIIKLMIVRLRAAGFRGPRPLLIKNGVPYVYVRN